MAKADLVTRLLIDSKQFDSSIRSSSYQINKFKSNIAGVATSVTSVVGGFAAFAGVSLAIGDAVRTSMEFEKSMSSLKALTQSSAQEMKFFQSEAIRMSSVTRQSAQKVVEAFQLIGGQKADLLQNKAALAEVTEQALVLSEAAGVDVPQAASALMMAMNQMGAKNSEARDYINILAAGAQEGAAEIPYLTQAIEKAGGTANAVGIKFNELVAAIEAIAPKVSDAGSAGLYLRNIFLTLEKSTDKNLKPSVVGLSAALKNLADKQMDVTELTKTFGAINVTAALALVNSREEYERLTETITGTNAAYEQQAIVNDNLAGAIDKAKGAYESLILSANKSNGVLKKTADFIADILRGIREAHFISDAEKMISNTTSATKIHVSNLDQKIKEEEDFVNPSTGKKTDRKDAIQKVIEGRYAAIDSLGKQYARELKKLNKLEDDAISYYKFSGGVKVSQDEIDEQKKTVEALERKNKIYQSGTEYLKEQLNLTTQIKEASATGGDEDAKVNLKGSIDAQNEIIKKLKEQFNAAADEGTRIGLSKAIANAEKELKLMITRANFKTELLITPKVVGLSSAEKKVNELVAGDIKSGKINTKGIGVSTDTIQVNNDYAQSLTAISSAMSAMNSITAEGAIGWLQWGSTLLSSIASAIPAIASLTAANSGLATANAKAAMTGAAASTSSIPVVGWVMAIGAVASMAAAFASMPKFADGGVVPGGAFVGDKVMARLNSGEMVLNHGQQSRLWNILQNGGGMQGNIKVSGTIKASGKDLIATISNYQNKQGRI